MQSLFGIKKRQGQVFLEDGDRVSVTLVAVADLPVVQVKTKEKDGYAAVQVGIGKARKDKLSKALAGHLAKGSSTLPPKVLREIRLSSEDQVPNVGDMLRFADILKPGDKVDVTGISKGKGFAGGVKRYQFRGGPRTHGQSDRERAPGSLGQTTTPGRVYKGKRMAGRMGQDTVTVRNLMIVAVEGDTVYVKGLLPGSVNSIVRINKRGEAKHFVKALFSPRKDGEEKQVEVVGEETKGTEGTKETQSQSSGQAEVIKEEENAKS